MRHTGTRRPTRMGVRGATLVAIAIASMLFGPALAAGIVAPTHTSAALAPVNTVAPKLTGTPTVGQKLSCSQGSWANNPTGFSYTWLRNGSPIPGQAGNTYVVQSADKGHSLTCQVTASNAGGDYTIPGLPSGSYKVTFRPEGEDNNYLEQFYNGKSLFEEATPVAVTAPNATGGVNAELHPGGQISGRVTDAATHTPIANIFACAEEASKFSFNGCAVTNANGEYTIAGLPGGSSYKVEFSSLFALGGYLAQFYNGKAEFGEADSVVVTAGATTAGINAELISANQGGQISGTVTKASNAAAIEGVEVCAENTEEFEIFGCASTNSKGEYTITGLAAGSYRVSFSPETCGESGCTQLNYLFQYYNDKPLSSEADEVVVTANKTTSPINAKMAAGGQITGRVTSAFGGAPLVNVEACAYEAAKEEFEACGSTNGNGEYTISGLSSGSVKIRFSPEGSGNYLSQYYNNKASFSEADPISVTAGNPPTANINAALQAGGQITGRVTDASTHAPIEQVFACIEEAGVGCASTNANGEYTLSGLPTGSYTVEFFPNEGANYLSQSLAGISATAGAVTPGVNAELQFGAEIMGTVTDASTHAGLANIQVCAEQVGGPAGKCINTAGGSASASATSNALVVPAPNSSFTLAKAPKFEAKSDDILFFFKVVDPGTFHWGLSFKNSDVGFASAVDSAFGGSEMALAETSKKKAKSKKCKAGFVKHRNKCVHATVPFGSGAKSVGAGTVEIKVHASSKAIKGLKAGHTLHVSGPFTFQSALGGSPVARNVSVTVRMPKKKSKKHGKK